MTIVEIEQLERTHDVALSINPESGKIAARGAESSAVDTVIAAITPIRAEVATLLRQRQGLPPVVIIVRELNPAVPSLAVQKQNYRRWYMSQPTYSQPSEEELGAMWSALEEGDLTYPDFAHSISVRRANGAIEAIDRRGRVVEVSRYSPLAKQQKRLSDRENKEAASRMVRPRDGRQTKESLNKWNK